MIYIITRHVGAIEWLRKKGFNGLVFQHLESEQILAGNIYIGVLPVPLIQEILSAGSRFYLLVLPEVSQEQRGREMTPDEMDAAGAGLVEVKHIEVSPVDLTNGKSRI